MIAFGAGYILAAALVSLLPESLELLATAPLCVLAGYVLAHLFEHTFTTHFHFGEETHTEHVVDAASRASTALVGLALHAFFDGVAISSGFLVTPSLGVLDRARGDICTRCPKVSRSRRSCWRRAARAASARQAAGAPGRCDPGGCGPDGVFWAKGVKGVGLALSCGIALYVAATDLIPEINQQERRVTR